MDDVRHTEQGNTIDTALLRAFLRSALNHDAVSDGVNELLYEHLIERRYHPSLIASSLPRFINELVDAATDEDWRAIRDDLIADARDALGLD